MTTSWSSPFTAVVGWLAGGSESGSEHALGDDLESVALDEDERVRAPSPNLLQEAQGPARGRPLAADDYVWVDEDSTADSVVSLSSDAAEVEVNAAEVKVHATSTAEVEVHETSTADVRSHSAAFTTTTEWNRLVGAICERGYAAFAGFGNGLVTVDDASPVQLLRFHTPTVIASSTATTQTSLAINAQHEEEEVPIDDLCTTCSSSDDNSTPPSPDFLGAQAPCFSPTLDDMTLAMVQRWADMIQLPIPGQTYRDAVLQQKPALCRRGRGALRSDDG